MHEDQQTEWIESWRDEYLRELCAFANAGGGSLTIGINDKGQTVGVPNAKRLLEKSWGQGIEKIVHYCRDSQIPPPTYSCIGSVCAIFTATEKLARLRELTGEQTNEPSKKTSGSQAGSQKRIIEMMRENPHITTSQLAVALQISTRAVAKHLKELRTQEKIRHQGPKSGGYWEVMEH